MKEIERLLVEEPETLVRKLRALSKYEQDVLVLYAAKLVREKSERQFLALEMRADGHTYPMIAEALGIGEDRARRLFNRARTNMMKLLARAIVDYETERIAAEAGPSTTYGARRRVRMLDFRWSK